MNNEHATCKCAKTYFFNGCLIVSLLGIPILPIMLLLRSKVCRRINSQQFDGYKKSDITYFFEQCFTDTLQTALKRLLQRLKHLASIVKKIKQTRTQRPVSPG